MLMSEISCIYTIGKNSKNKMLKNPVIHDIIATLFVFDWICTSENMKENSYKELNLLMNKRFQKHKDYFTKDSLLIGTYIFTKKVIDYLTESFV